jgi:hypothetical protein
MRLVDIEQKSPAEFDYANTTGVLPQQPASDLKLTGSLSMESVDEIGDEVYHATGVRPPTSVQVSGDIDKMADMVTRLGGGGGGGNGAEAEDAYSDDSDFEEDDDDDDDDDNDDDDDDGSDSLSTASAPQGRGGLLSPLQMRPYRSVQDGAFGVPSSSPLRGRGLSMSDLARPSPTPPPSSRKGRPDGWWRNDNTEKEKEEEEENSDDQYSFERKKGERQGRLGRGKNNKKFK